ncbi:MAG TPA: HAD hydrolase family protein [Candidatus Onthousia excrementipullorum]|uniref:HAD hydrolase family protein n=1 Tax=Candidatus Onthousia excrementipullorum TaxID=2840884 RepID=A0A9D1DUJ7_9FIRM|nr:HAD hydrolase family protein [Candidatus Onthousia excrementipullorum]
MDKELVDSILEYANNDKDIYDVILISAFDKNVTDTLNIVKIMLKLYSYDKALEVKNYIDKSYTNIKSYFISEDNHYLVEVVSSEASKSLMIDKILDKEGIVKNNVYTIGDGINDIEMIRDYNGYRVRNSCKELVSVTDRVIDNVSDLISRISN